MSETKRCIGFFAILFYGRVMRHKASFGNLTGGISGGCFYFGKIGNCFNFLLKIISLTTQELRIIGFDKTEVRPVIARIDLIHVMNLLDKNDCTKNKQQPDCQLKKQQNILKRGFSVTGCLSLKSRYEYFVPNTIQGYGYQQQRQGDNHQHIER